MMRGFAVLVSALAAFAAQAQEAGSSKTAGKTSAAVPQENTEHGVMLASRSATPLSRSSRPSAPGDGAGAGTKVREGAADEPADCSIVEALLGSGALAVRTYRQPLSAQASDTKGWEKPPYVAAIAQCGHVYFLQVMSRSRDAWVIQRARLVAPDGEVLQVAAIRFSTGEEGWNINVIVATVPPTAKVPKLRLHLTGEDGRVAQTEVRDLP